MEPAEENITKAFKIYENNQHPQIYRCFEYLAEIYRLKMLKADGNKLKKEYHDKYIKYLQLAIKNAKETLPADSSHLQRILESMQKNELYSQ
ncbi:MAG: hypothetical protein HRU35_07170 [Rickettsiaceae bacterium]|nr:hypothetical protein [Rickettsiaceae bacterium]